MIKSEQINELAKALSAFQSEMKTVSFDKDNLYFKSKYATLTNIVDSARALLSKYGLSVSQLTTGDGGVTTLLLHTSGQFIGDTLTLRPSKDDPQGHGSAITYARRYSYASILGIVSDEDDDGNAASNAKPTVSQPQSKSLPANGNVMSGKQYVKDMAIKYFGDMDKFTAWAVDMGYPDKVDSYAPKQLETIASLLKNSLDKKK